MLPKKPVFTKKDGLFNNGCVPAEIGMMDEQLAELIGKGQFLEYIKMVKKYRSNAFAAIHETMEALHEIGAVDKQTMREFDESCLIPAQIIIPR
jgi:putative transcriptional regulator